MKIWPISTIKHSPLFPAYLVPEVENIANSRFLSRMGLQACADTAAQTKPLDTPNLAFVPGLDCPFTALYTNYPDWEEWRDLERSAVLSLDGHNYFVISVTTH